MATVMDENANPMNFEKLFKVTSEMIDENKHMNNVWAVQWVQDISIAHSDSVGATDVMYQLGCGWMMVISTCTPRACSSLMASSMA